MHRHGRQAVIFALLVTLVTSATIFIPGVPCDPMTLYQLQVGSDILLNDLRANPTLPVSKGFTFYKDTYFVNYMLQKLSNDEGLKHYTNVIYGKENGIKNGHKNIIFGNNNEVSGNNNYIFSEDFNSTAVKGTDIENHLVLD